MSTTPVLHRIADLMTRRGESTKKEATARIRAARLDGLLPRGLTQAAAVESVCDLAAKQSAIRQKRVALAVRPELSFDKRVAARTIAAVKAAAKGLYRTASAGDHTSSVTIGEANAAGETSPGERYSSRCSYRKTDSKHSYTVPFAWMVRVQGQDLERLDGMLTLDAEPIQGHGPDLFRAVWVEQGRGMSLNTVRGYIARDPATRKTYHAASARAALDGLARKLGTKPPRRRGTVDLNRLVRRHGDLPVYWGDHDGIACDSGTRSWCAAVGIDVESGCTVADVVAGYRLRPHAEALQIVRRVVRDRRNRQPLDMSVPESSLEQQGRVVFDAEGGFRILPPESAN